MSEISEEADIIEALEGVLLTLPMLAAHREILQGAISEIRRLRDLEDY